MPSPIPIEIKLIQKQRLLEIIFDNNKQAKMSCLFLRQNSPSAEMRKKKPDVISEHVNIVAIEPVGHYAVKLIFDDGHQTGIFSFDYLYQLCQDNNLFFEANKS